MEELKIVIPGRKTPVSGLLLRPDSARHLLVLGHGAGAGMRHAFMEQLAIALSSRGVATLRYQFPYMEEGRRRPDRPEVSQVTIRAVLDYARDHQGDLPLYAGGKSYGGRMTSLLAAADPELPVRGLVFYGFPLHPAGNPGTKRAGHLSSLRKPLLFLQGTRDRLADEVLIRELCQGLPTATLYFLEEGDHSFRMPKKAALSQEEAIIQAAQWTAEWMEETA